MDEVEDVSPPHRTRLHSQKKKGEEGPSSGKHGNTTTEAPTAKVGMEKLRRERDLWKARAELLEGKIADITKDRDIYRAQLSDALASLKEAKSGGDSDIEEVRMQESSGSESEDDDSESSSDDSESSESSPERKRKKKGKGKRKKGGKKKRKKEKKSKNKHGFRQRVGGPSDVVRRYKKVLAIFQTGKSMAKSFEKYGVDRLTIVKTAAIAELAIAAPEEYDLVEKGGTVADFAKRCEEVIKANNVISATITKMKDDRKLLRITKKV